MTATIEVVDEGPCSAIEAVFVFGPQTCSEVTKFAFTVPYIIEHLDPDYDPFFDPGPIRVCKRHIEEHRKQQNREGGSKV